MAREAERGLAWREEYNRGGTEVGVARARDIKNRKNLSPDTVRRMKSYFARHEVDKKGEGFSPGEEGYPSAGRIAWALWGGDPGQSWANRKSDELDNEAENMAAKSKWYAIQSTQDGEAEITLFDEIGFGGTSAKAFIADLKKLSGQHLHLRINSVGGSVVEGTAIYNALRRHKGGLTVHVEALAASMASVVAMAGEEVAIADNALLMIHNPWSMSMGDADDLRKEADVLDKLKSTLVNAYKRKTGMDADEISDMMNEETWLGAEEAVALGFADYIEDGMEAAASITPEQARARFDTFSNSMARKSTKTIKAEEAAPAEVIAEAVVEEPVADVAVDNSEEVNMNAELQAKVDALQAELNAKVEADTVRAQADEVTAKEIETLKSEVACRAGIDRRAEVRRP
ncbi:MAG: head maturation protease, ClpP-related [Chthoniobacterales bacterium]